MTFVWSRNSHAFLSLALLTLVSAARAESLKVMSYNLQNLFDTFDNPGTNDEEFTPNGAQRWTPQILSDKMRNLAEVIRQESPDVIGVQEIENQAVLDQFLNTNLSTQGYRYALAADSRDSRGIRPGIISKFPIVESRSVPVDNTNWVDPRDHVRKAGRDILVVTVDTGISGPGRLVTLLVNHWLSKGGGPVRDAWREQEGRAASGIVADIVRRNPERLVILMGDLNDELNSRPLARGVNQVPSLQAFESASPDRMFAVDSQLGADGPDTGTHYFFPAHEWNRLDHMFIAYGDKLRSGAVRGFKYVDQSVHVVHSRFVQAGGQPEGCELQKWEQRRRPVRASCPDGASDHFPIAATFEVQ